MLGYSLSVPLQESPSDLLQELHWQTILQGTFSPDNLRLQKSKLFFL